MLSRDPTCHLQSVNVIPEALHSPRQCPYRINKPIGVQDAVSFADQQSHPNAVFLLGSISFTATTIDLLQFYESLRQIGAGPLAANDFAGGGSIVDDERFKDNVVYVHAHDDHAVDANNKDNADDAAPAGCEGPA